MNSRSTFPSIMAVGLVALAVISWPVQAGEFKFQDAVNGNFFDVSPPCPVKQFPTFESLVPIPGFTDPFEQDLIPVFCQIQVSNDGKGVKGAKGRYGTELIVRDNRTGLTENFAVGSGSFRTNRNGADSFDFDIPSEIFADGFESGDVSAWSYTRTDFTNRKNGNQAQVNCGTRASKSN